MPTQMQHLQQERIRAEARLGKDDLFVKALRQRLEGYRSMDANSEENFLLETRSAPPTESTETEAQGESKELQ